MFGILQSTSFVEMKDATSAVYHIPTGFNLQDATVHAQLFDLPHSNFGHEEHLATEFVGRTDNITSSGSPISATKKHRWMGKNYSFEERKMYERRRDEIKRGKQKMGKGEKYFNELQKVPNLRNVTFLTPKIIRRQIKHEVRALLQGLPEIRFFGDVIEQQPPEALGCALQEEEGDVTGERLVMWTKGNARKGMNIGTAGAGVVYRTKPWQQGIEQWGEKAWHIPNIAIAYRAELVAIAEALDIALSEAHEQRTARFYQQNKESYRNNPLSEVVIYTTSQSALRRIRNLRHIDPLWKDMVLSRIVARTWELERLGVGVCVQWVPDWDGVEGNAKADRVARWGAKHVPDPGRICYGEKYELKVVGWA